PVGQRQAELAAARLAAPRVVPALPVPAGPPLEIVHSPLARTAETAAFVEAAFVAGGRGPVPPRRADHGFTEIGQGAWEGLRHDEIRARWGDVLATWRRRPLEAWAPGGESLPEVQARVRPAVRALLAPLADGRPPGTLDRSQ